MDVHTAVINNNMDCNFDEMGLKNRKTQQFEDRVDSGVDSLKEDEYIQLVEEMENLTMPCKSLNTYETHAPWKQEVTEDGDT